jgi:cysteine-rich repeat protein
VYRSERGARTSSGDEEVLVTLRPTPVLFALALVVLLPSVSAAAVCGDAQLDPGEQCDDGNTVGGDGCTDSCLIECPSLQGTWSSVCFGNPGCGETTLVQILDDGAGNLLLGGFGEPKPGTRTPGVLSDVTFFENGQTFLIGPTDCASMTLELSAPGTGVGVVLTKVSSSLCGDGVLDAGEECDDGNFSNLDLCSDSCEVRLCGNGTVDPGEECDDGNFVDGDLCTTECTDAECGNEIVEPGEACDDGNLIDGDGCSSSCAVNTCGNSVLEPGEQCDDGNVANGDGCSSLCQVTACGNGTLDPGEQCDDGNTVGGDGCTDSCLIECPSLQGTWSSVCFGNPSCGESTLVQILDDGAGNLVLTGINEPKPGIRTPGVISDVTFFEDGDPFLSGPTDCVSMTLYLNGTTSFGLSLKRVVCGDGVVDDGEECDDGNADETDACLSSCEIATCGDGFTQAGVEECDDGNLEDGDGCEASCIVTLCSAETAIMDARVTIASRTETTGDEKLLLKGRLVLPPGSPAVDPASSGVQVVLEGAGSAPIFDLSAGTSPIPAATAGACGAGDGWKVRSGRGLFEYANRSGAIDPPTCTAGSANGLYRARIVENGGSGDLRFVFRAKRASISAPGSGARVSVVLGQEAGTAGACGRVELTCVTDRAGKTTRCE